MTRETYKPLFLVGYLTKKQGGRGNDYQQYHKHDNRLSHASARPDQLASPTYWERGLE
jgi:hypothetical protein